MKHLSNYPDGDRTFRSQFETGSVDARQRDVRVVVMAGGLGTRLLPATETVPKPMLTVGGRPILETILRMLILQGFCHFTLSVNYMAKTIEDHFGDGTSLGASIDYVHEARRMGTAGALSLLPEYPEGPFVVMNCDVLTTLDFGSLLDFHTQTGSAATMCIRELPIQVPFGVVSFEGRRFRSIVEKPVLPQYINTGIYILSPATLDHAASTAPLDMPQLFERVSRSGKPVSVYHMADYWIDIGRPEELKRARAEFPGVFGDVIGQ